MSGHHVYDWWSAVVDLAPWEHRAAWPPDVRHVAAAREFVAGHLVQHHLDHEVDILRLVVSELATNAVVHARSPFVVTMARVDHTLMLTVSDESLDLPRDSRRPSTRRQRGRGLNIVEHLSSQWGVRPEQGGKTVWARFALEA